MPITNDNKYKINMYPALSLVQSLIDLINGKYWYDIDDDDVEKAAMSSYKCLPTTALHRILYHIAYIDFYLFGYDDRDWVVDEDDAVALFESWMPHMGITPPQHYNTLEELDAFLTAEKFLCGLNKIVDSAFSILRLNQFGLDLERLILVLFKYILPISITFSYCPNWS